METQCIYYRAVDFPASLLLYLYNPNYDKNSCLKGTHIYTQFKVTELASSVHTYNVLAEAMATHCLCIHSPGKYIHENPNHFRGH